MHIIKSVIERDIAGSQDPQQRISYDLHANDQGAIFGSSGISARDQSVTDSLDWELNVCYEFGDENYVISKNGQLVQDNDVWTPTVIQKRARIAAPRLELPKYTKDPRLEDVPKLERVKQEPRGSGFHSHY